MPDLSAPAYWLARLVIERGLAALYCVAFVVALKQFPALCGDHGLEPARSQLERVRFLQSPSLFHWGGYSDRRLRVLAWTGIVLSVSLVLGLPQHAPLLVTMATWLVLWVLYQSIVNVGGTFYRFGWETMLLEAGFLAIFLGNAKTAAQWPVLIAFRWLAFRIEFGAGLIKLRGDPCWKDLSCMDYHHETQPMPNGLSRWFHRMPKPLHRAEVLGNFFAQLVLPFGLFLPQPIAGISAGLMIATQLYLVLSGNYAWLNWLTIITIMAGVASPFGPSPTVIAPTPGWFTVVVLTLGLTVAVLSYWPVRNMLSPNQAMNASFEPFHLVNTYGAFGSVSRRRFEVIIEGTMDIELGPHTHWKEYEFKGKPGSIGRTPPQMAPYHLRLDWLMWFIPLSPRFAEGWFLTFLWRLLEADAPTLALLERDPFHGHKPLFVRARMYQYWFATKEEHRATGAVWRRNYVGEYVRPMSLWRSGGPEPTRLRPIARA